MKKDTKEDLNQEEKSDVKFTFSLGSNWLDRILILTLIGILIYAWTQGYFFREVNTIVTTDCFTGEVINISKQIIR